MAFLYVKAYHGPCNSFNSCIHKPQFLSGLRDRLQQLGFRVDLVPVKFVNYCMLEICGHEVFRCNINHLQFNTEYSDDLVCQRAIDAVLRSSVKFRRARAYLWFWTLLEHQLFNRGKYAANDYWLSKIDLSHLSDIPEHIDICHYISKKEEVKDDPFAFSW